MSHKLVKPRLEMKNLILIAIYIVCVGCGVRGDPLPPETPAELGRGRPNYKRATEGIQLKDPQDIENEGFGVDDDDDDEEEVF